MGLTQGCGWIGRPSEPAAPPAEIQLALPDSRLLRLCADPVTGWAAAETQEKQEALIRHDQRSLKICRDRHAALATWAQETVAFFGERSIGR